MPKQVLLIIGALLLLSQISLNVNKSTLDMYDVSYDNEALLTATNIAESILQEVAAKPFDENVIGKSVSNPDTLTSPLLLGPEYGEEYPSFDDVDDYNGHVRTISSGRLGNFTVTVSVCYTTRALLGNCSSSRTFLKKVAVEVSGNPKMKNSVSASSIVAY
jgi:hypothetical protein